MRILPSSYTFLLQCAKTMKVRRDLKKFTKWDNFVGITIALTILFLWGISLFFLLSYQITALSHSATFLLMLWQTFLYTGLFITAHDAMHGTIFPANRRINNAIGSLAVFLYALFSYKKLHTKHWEHHRHPASEDDPDFHDGEHTSFWRWYSHFMVNYLSVWQLLGMTIVYNILKFGLGIPDVNLICFWVIPSLLSTVQLFYFGTFLPHRQPAEGYTDHHRAKSNSFSTLWSFVTCFHFGYHWEHHAFPYVPWWKLPQKRREMLKASG